MIVGAGVGEHWGPELEVGHVRARAGWGHMGARVGGRGMWAQSKGRICLGPEWHTVTGVWDRVHGVRVGHTGARV